MNDYAFRLEGISRQYAFFRLQQVSMALEKGQILGFIGPNGAGKTTTLRILMGLVAADSGSVEVLGQPMSAGAGRIKQDIGYVSSEMQPFQSETVGWHLNWVARLYPGWDESYAKTLLQRFNLHAQQKARQLSSGERMKLLLLLVLARRPRLLVLDEPTTGLDPVARHELLTEITAIMQDEERAVLLSSHYTQDVEQISDQIVFIDRGRIVAANDRERFLETWRRVVVDVPDTGSLPRLPGMVTMSSQSPHSAVLTFSDFDEAVLAGLEGEKSRICRVETMTLEEIFVASVMHDREGEKRV